LNSNLSIVKKEEKFHTDLSKFDILIKENQNIEEINRSRKEYIDNKLHGLLDCFKKGDNAAFTEKYSELEKLAINKENFYQKTIDLRNLNNNKIISDNVEDINSQSQSEEEDLTESGKLRKDNFDDEADAKFAYDKNREFLNTDINLRLKSDLDLMNNFNNFEEGLNMSKSLIDYSNTIHKDHYDKDNKTSLNNKQQKQIKGKNQLEYFL